MSSYSFFMQKSPIGGVVQPVKNLEAEFQGLKYLEFKGLDSYGKPKVYTETFSESSDMKVFVPKGNPRDNPDLELKLAFTGDNRRDVYHSFVEYITGSPILYFDTCRRRRVVLILMDSISVDSESLYGSNPYIIVPFKFKNLSGNSEKYTERVPVAEWGHWVNSGEWSDVDVFKFKNT